DNTNTILVSVADWLGNTGVPESAIEAFATLIVVSLSVAFGIAVYYMCTRVLAPVIESVVAKTKAKWDDVLLNKRMVKALSQLILICILNLTLPDACDFYPALKTWMSVIMRVLLVTGVVVVINRLLVAVYDILCSQTTVPAQSLRGLREMLQILVICIGVIIAVSILVDRSPLIILSGLGASAAVLMLVFKDSILGLVSGVRLTMNDMLRPGDWITAPKFGANGIVQEVNLTTVKVQNFDMTIVTIPPYSLVSDSFQNWRGMQECPGRRVARSICIDINSIHFLNPDELDKYRSEPWASDLDLTERQANLALFRRYLEHYITGVATTVRSMIVMVRELQPTPQGIPVEIYFFTNRQDWLSYEHVQADLLDYVVAVLPEFGLRVYQAPSGLDVLSLKDGSVVAE
ncbi:MAG: mechanosensitive ion channel family protein, partial [Muribaculaceae bacterium]|nr:mechanosensitive ion channel family protein [Muribaculaceae bacterium]